MAVSAAIDRQRAARERRGVAGAGEPRGVVAGAADRERFADVPLAPANTVTEEPVVVLLPLDTDAPEVAALVKPLLVTVAVSPLAPFTHVLAASASRSCAYW